MPTSDERAEQVAPIKAHHLISTDTLHTCLDCGAHTVGGALPELPCPAECGNPDSHEWLGMDR